MELGKYFRVGPGRLDFWSWKLGCNLGNPLYALYVIVVTYLPKYLLSTYSTYLGT